MARGRPTGDKMEEADRCTGREGEGCKGGGDGRALGGYQWRRLLSATPDQCEGGSARAAKNGSAWHLVAISSVALRFGCQLDSYLTGCLPRIGEGIDQPDKEAICWRNVDAPHQVQPVYYALLAEFQPGRPDGCFLGPFK